MLHRAMSIMLCAGALLLVACQTTGHDNSQPTTRAATNERDQGYALLYSTIDDESGVDKVLMIKDPSPPVTELVKAIALFSRNAKTKLQTFAKEDPSLGLKNQGLPEVETSTRDAISSVTAKQLLFSGGKEFEFRILMTQHDALNYITHLAGEVGKREDNERRKQFLTQLAVDAKALHERVLAQLKAAYVGQAK